MSGSRWRSYGVAAGFLAPAFVLLGVWIVYPMINTTYRSFFDRSGDEFVGIRQLSRALHPGHARHGDQEQRALGPFRPRVRHRYRARLRRARREGAVLGRLQDGRVHADGDLAVRCGRHLARDVRAGARPGRRERRDRGRQGRGDLAGRALERAALDRRARGDASGRSRPRRTDRGREASRSWV